MNDQIAITGSTGFIGSNLLPYLQQCGINCFSVVRDNAMRSNNVCSVPLSRFDSGYINANRISSIIHMAGKAHDLWTGADETEYFLVNTEITKRIYDTFLASDASLFIYISSVKAVIDQPTGIVTEDILPDPKTPYGRSKQDSETYIRSIALPQQKRYIILRPCMIHGPGNKGNLNFLYKFISLRIPYPLGAFHNERSFLSIDNFCYLIHRLLEYPGIASGIYNIADDKPLSTIELIEEIGAMIHKRPIILNWNTSLVKLIAKFGDRLHLPFNSHNLQKLTENYIVSNQKILGALNTTLPVSSLDGIRKTVRSFSRQ